MVLNSKHRYVLKECTCNLTEYLDQCANIHDVKYDWDKHCVLINDICIKRGYAPVRLKGDIVCGIWFDDDFVITDVLANSRKYSAKYGVDSDYRIQQFIGEKIYFGKNMWDYKEKYEKVKTNEK